MHKAPNGYIYPIQPESKTLLPAALRPGNLPFLAPTPVAGRKKVDLLGDIPFHSCPHPTQPEIKKGKKQNLIEKSPSFPQLWIKEQGCSGWMG